MNERPYTPPPCAVNENGANRLSWKIVSPNSAIRMSGVPATISMLVSTKRASQDGRPYSTIQTAAETARGVASATPISVSRAVPRIGSRNPPVPACDVPTCGRLSSRLGRRYWIPRTPK